MPTPVTVPSRRASRAPVLVVLLALVLAACGGGSGDPAEELADAFQATFEDSFTYRFVVDADQSAMAALGDGAGQAAAFLSGFAIAGSVDDDAVSAQIQALGTSLLEVRSIGDDELYVRVGVQELLGMLGGGFAAEDVVPGLEAMGFDAETQGLVLAALRGEWIGLEGGFDASQLGDVTGQGGDVDDEDARAAVEEAFGEDLPTFFERFVTVAEDPRQDDGGESFTVALQLRELLRAASSISEDVGASDELPVSDLEADLAELPATVPGEVVVRDGVVTRIAFRAADTLRESGGDVDGDIDLVLELADHGDVPEIAPPPDATVVTDEQVQRLFEQLAGLADMGLGSFTP